jgi:hypothetical protein
VVVWATFSIFEVQNYVNHLVDCFLVWLLPFDLFGNDDPTSSYTTTSIALRVIAASQLSHLIKVMQYLGMGIWVNLVFRKNCRNISAQ